MSASRDALIDVLIAHEYDGQGGCRCYWVAPTGSDERDHPNHVADALAQAGIHPFRPDHVEQP